MNSEEFQSVCKLGTGFSDEDLKKHPELVKGYIGPMALGPQARDEKKPIYYKLS